MTVETWPDPKSLGWYRWRVYDADGLGGEYEGTEPTESEARGAAQWCVWAQAQKRTPVRIGGQVTVARGRGLVTFYFEEGSA